MTYSIVTSLHFDDWLKRLGDEMGKAKIIHRIRLAERGHFGDCKHLGDGLSEMRIHHGPGYRLYFAIRNREVVVFLAGGSKGSQTREIARAKQLLKSYKGT